MVVPLDEVVTDPFSPVLLLLELAVGNAAPIEWQSIADTDFDDNDYKSKWSR